MTATGRVSVVTGAGSGIGAAAALALARHGDTVVLVGRRQSRLDHTADRIEKDTGTRPRSYAADFSSLDAVRRLGATLTSTYPRIDVLANNAGMIGGLRHSTVDGHELVMQVNHLAPFLLTYLLLPSLRAAPVARVIGTASAAEAVGIVDPTDLDSARLPIYARWVVYGATKKANILFAYEAAHRLAGTHIVPTSFHPGLVRSRFGTTSASFSVGKLLPLVFVSPKRGADTLVHLATHEDGLACPGGYFYRRKPRWSTPDAQDPDLARALWDASAAAVGVPADWVTS